VHKNCYKIKNDTNIKPQKTYRELYKLKKILQTSNDNGRGKNFYTDYKYGAEA